MADKNDIVAKPEPGKSGGALQRLENALVVEHGDDVIETDFHTPKRIGLWIAFVVFGVFGLFAALVPLAESAHAPGTVTVKSYKKVIQHLEGGIVKEIRVQNGDAVNAGDVLLVMDNTQSLAQLGIASGQLKALLAQEARLIAERDGSDAVEYPASLSPSDPGASTEMNAQNQIFTARKTAYEGETAVLEQRVDQLQSSIGGLTAQRQSKEALLASFAEELVDTQALLKEGFSDKLRLRELERNHAQLNGDIAELTANIAATQIQMGATQLEIIQLKNRLQSEVVDELSKVQTNLQDVQERYTALSDIVKRTEVTAPDAGVVNGLQVHTLNAVIPPGQVIAEIVPQTDQLIVEARVSPMDRDRIAMGQQADVRMSAFNSRTTPTLKGTLIGLSADSMADQQTGMAYYIARVEIMPDSLVELNGQELVPGMPAEVFINTGSRTFLQMLAKPFSDSVARSFIED